MRIIAGEKKGFILKAPRGQATRPTLGRVREALFSILQHEVPGAIVADLFAGAGSLGLEALSRGAAECTFVEKAQGALEALTANVEKLGYQSRCRILRADVVRWLQMQKSSGWPQFSLVLCDPPYDTGLASQATELIAFHLPLQLGAIIVVQTSPREELPETCGRLRHYRSEAYGDTVLHFFVAGESR